MKKRWGIFYKEQQSQFLDSATLSTTGLPLPRAVNSASQLGPLSQYLNGLIHVQHTQSGNR